MRRDMDWFALLDEILARSASSSDRIIADVPHDWIAAYGECHPEKTEVVSALASPFFIPPEPIHDIETLIRSLLLGRDLWKPGLPIQMPSRWLGMPWIKPLIDRFNIQISTSMDDSPGIDQSIRSADSGLSIRQLIRAESLSALSSWIGVTSLGRRIRWTWKKTMTGDLPTGSIQSLESALRAILPAEPDENAFVVFSPSSNAGSLISVSQIPAPGFGLFNAAGDSVLFQKTEPKDGQSILFQSKSVGIGLKTFRFKPVETVPHATDLAAGRFFLENDRLRVDVSPNGLVNVTDKLTGNRFRGLNAPSISGKPIKPSSVRLSLVESGPLRGVIKIRMRLKPPESRHGSTEVVKIWSTVRLGAGDGHLEFETEIKNPFDQTVSMRFPTDCQTRQSRALIGFGQISHESIRPTRCGPDESHFQHGIVWVSDDNRGLALVMDRPGLYHLGLDARRTLNMELGNCGVGGTIIKYGLVPFDTAKEPEGTSAFQAWEAVARPSIVFENLALKRDTPIVQVKPESLLASLKESEDGSDIILRLWNPLNQPVKSCISVQPSVSEVWLCDPDETPLNRLYLSDGSFQIVVEKHGISAIQLINNTPTF